MESEKKLVTETILKIKKIIADGLPGVDAQDIMSPVVSSQKYRQVPSDHKKAGVLALIYPKEDELYMVFIVRSSHDVRDKHAGQIGFPGGQYEAADKNMEATALRETYEEIGVDPGDVRIITPLTELYVFASNYLVSPYLGYIPYTPTFIPQLSEVAEVLEIPLSYFSKGIKERKDFSVRGNMLKDVPYYNLDGRSLWGATAMIMSEIEEIIKNI